MLISINVNNKFINLSNGVNLRRIGYGIKRDIKKILLYTEYSPHIVLNMTIQD